MLKINHIFLNNSWVKEKVIREITVCFALNDNKKIWHIKTLLSAAKAVFGGKHHFKFLYLKRRFKLNDLKFPVRNQIKIKKVNPKSRVKEAIKKISQQNENRT